MHVPKLDDYLLELHFSGFFNNIIVSSNKTENRYKPTEVVKDLFINTIKT